MATYRAARYTDDEMGEFWDDRTNDSFVAHAQCGLDYDFELA